MHVLFFKQPLTVSGHKYFIKLFGPNYLINRIISISLAYRTHNKISETLRASWNEKVWEPPPEDKVQSLFYKIHRHHHDLRPYSLFWPAVNIFSTYSSSELLATLGTCLSLSEYHLNTHTHTHPPVYLPWPNAYCSDLNLKQTNKQTKFFLLKAFLNLARLASGPLLCIINPFCISFPIQGCNLTADLPLPSYRTVLSKDRDQ